MSASTTEQFQEASTIFDNAIRDFRGSLSAVDQQAFREFDSPWIMIEEIKGHCARYFKGRKMDSICRRIAKFASAWEPFFDITTIFVSSHPEWAGIAWGAIRMVFLLSSNYNAFLEKLTLMFEKITQRLPVYKEHLKRLKIHKKKEPNVAAVSSPADERLVKALSLIYADIIQFCQQACKIFATKKGGIKYKPFIIHDIWWKPFDVRFSSLLTSLRDHQDWFESELRLRDSKQYQCHMETTEATQRAASQALGDVTNLLKDSTDASQRAASQVSENVTNLWKDLKRQNDLEDDRNRERLEGLDRRLAELQRRAAQEHHRIAEAKEEAMATKVQELKRWLNAPLYRAVFERARRIRLPHTAGWITDTKSYKAWYNLPMRKSDCIDVFLEFKTPSSFGSRTLFIQAKPGYGKTIMSSAIIEHLQSHPETAIIGSHVPRNVAFYHFSRGRVLEDPYAAFRSILVQLLHLNRGNDTLVDALSLLMDSTGSGQEIASNDDTKAALLLFTAELPGTFIVIDGVDECADSTLFLELIYEVCKDSFFKIILLSRPNVKLPTTYQHGLVKMKLTAKENDMDIKRYLMLQFEHLLESGDITTSMADPQIVKRTSLRARGMFLWAFLLIQYLQCSGLSPAEKLDVLQETGRLEELDEMYERILKALTKGYLKERQRVHRIFQLVAVALRPLTVDELQIAIAIQPGSITSETSYVPRFKEVLVLLCGALIEIDLDNTTSFIHSSARDFITDKSAAMHPDIAQFHVDVGSANILLGSICLSYLVYDSSRSNPAPPEYSLKQCPLLTFPQFRPYSIYWPDHIQFSVIEYDTAPSRMRDETWKEAILHLSKFLLTPISVMIWIETSWTFGTEPTIQRLTDTIRNFLLRGRFPSTIGSAESLPVMRLMCRFSDQLLKINQDWGYLLRTDPSQIWSSSFAAFTNSEFLLSTSEAKVTPLRITSETWQDQDGETFDMNEGWITIASQTSSDGTMVGVVTLLPSRQYIDFVKSHAETEKDTSQTYFPKSAKATEEELKLLTRGWKLKYIGLSVKELTSVFNIEMDLSGTQISAILRLSPQFSTSDRFPFPVFISANLCQIFVLRTLIRIPQSSTELRAQTHGSRARFQTQLLVKRSPDSTNPNDDYIIDNVVFSPDSTSIAIIEGRGSRKNFVSWRIRVWQDLNPKESKPQFLFRGAVQPSHFSKVAEGNFMHVAFHPWHPYIVFPQWCATSVWWFGGEENHSVEIICYVALTHLKVGNDNEIWGIPLGCSTDPESGVLDRHEKVAIEKCPKLNISATIEKYTMLANSQNGSCHDTNKESPPSSPSQAQPLNEDLDLSPATRQDGSQLLLTPFQKQAVCDVQVAQRANPQGYRAGDFAFHLPQLQIEQDTSLSYIRPQVGDEWINVIWNKRLQVSYSVLDASGLQLPVLFAKRRHSPNANTSIEDERPPKRLRAEAFGETHRPKRIMYIEEESEIGRA